MLLTNSDKVLFPEELIPCEGVLGVIAALRHPNRIHAKGISCITGFSVSIRREDLTNFWLPVVPDQKLWSSLNDTLLNMPILAYPLSVRVIHEFLDEYILQNWDIKYVPTFLSGQTLLWDLEKRVSIYQLEVEELLRLFLLGKVELTDQSRYILDEKTHASFLGQSGIVFFTREEAVRYLQRKSYLTNAHGFCAPWKDIIRRTNIETTTVDENSCCFGYPTMLREEGIDRYRNWLRLQRPSNRQSNAIEEVHLKDGESFTDQHSKHNVAQASFTIQDQDAFVSEQLTSDEKIADLNTARRSNEMPTSNNLCVQPSVIKSNKHTIREIPPENLVLNQNSKEKDLTLVGMDIVCSLTSYERATIFNYVNPKSQYFDPDFPKSQKINGVNKWFKIEIENWINLKMKRKSIT